MLGVGKFRGLHEAHFKINILQGHLPMSNVYINFVKTNKACNKVETQFLPHISR